MPSQSVEAATREEAIEAAREEYGPSVKIVGVRRIRSGGVMGFFTSERYVAEVDLAATKAAKAAKAAGAAKATAARSTAGQDAGRRPARAAATDDRMGELADLLRPASGEIPIGLYTSAGVPQAPAIEDVLAQRRPRTGASAAPAPRAAAPRAAAPAAAGRFADSLAAGRTASPAPARSAADPWGGASTRSAAAGRAAAFERPASDRSAAFDRPATGSRPATASRPATTGRPAARARTVAEARAAAAPAAASPFAPKRHRPTLDGLVDSPVAPAAPAGTAAPSPFTAALARMVADGQVSAAVADAVDRAEESALADLTILRQPVIEDFYADEPVAEEPAFDEPIVEELVEDELVEDEPVVVAPVVQEPVVEEFIPAEPVVEAPVVVAPPVIEAPVIEAPVVVAPETALEPMDQRAVLQSALQSVLTAAGPGAADPDVERLLQGVLERVLAGDAVKATALPAATSAELTVTGRHRFPDHLAHLDRADPAEAELVEAELVDEELLEGEVFDDVFDDARYGDDVFTAELYLPRPDAGQVPSGQVPAAAHADAWGARTDRVHDIRSHETRRPHDVRDRDVRTQEFRIDVRDHEVLAQHESRVMTPATAVWPSLARTASDPAPLPMDATTILPPLSLLPPHRSASSGGLPPLLSGRPAVPPPRRRLSEGPGTLSTPAAARPTVPAPALESAPAGTALATTEAPFDATDTLRGVRLTLSSAPVPDRGGQLATVTRLVRSVSTEMAPFGISGSDELVVRLLALGLPEFLIAPDFAADAAVRGTYAALTRTLADRLPPLPEVPTEPGDALLVVGPGPETLTAARSLAASLRLDPARVQWATPSDAAYLAPEHSRITTLETAAERVELSRRAGSVTIVAVDAPLRTGGGSWLPQMLSLWEPLAVWGVVDATRKLEDVVPWLDGLPRLDAVIVQDTDCTADPAAVLSSVSAPVARVDGARATAHRWASLLCERLEEMHA